ncbi:hypothetical protein EXIGLDRAFT_766288 [Exidia glandulosa HHB12029]|uniref:F-box domain-containing protein n=1 Tax=Exidia glandulosa HHB12029 TaxID=1314781 RepID=A0A165JV39_EXIGL|nr:hypothetical protein EXIGLDRAFT_766288 [Exidia glandulosa HHB12029]
MLTIANCLKEEHSDNRAETLISLSTTSRGIRAAVWPLLTHTLAVPIAKNEHFATLRQRGIQLPTRTLLLAVSPVSPHDLSSALLSFNSLSSLALVSLGPSFLNNGLCVSNTALTFNGILGIHSLQHTILRLSVACNLVDEMRIDRLRLHSFQNLTHLRLAIQADTLRIDATFALPQTLHTLSISPAITIALAPLDLPLPALKALEVVETDSSSVTWYTGDPTWVFPPPREVPLGAFSSAFARLLAQHTALSTVSVERISVSLEMLAAFRLLPDLQTLGLHPKSYTCRSPNDALPVHDCIDLFASTILPHLKSLRVLHIGALFHTDYPLEDLKRAAPSALHILAFGPCATADHLPLKPGPPPKCAAHPFSWAWDELEDIPLWTD